MFRSERDETGNRERALKRSTLNERSVTLPPDLPSASLSKLLLKSPLGVFIHKKRKQYKMADQRPEVRVDERLQIKIGE